MTASEIQILYSHIGSFGIGVFIGVIGSFFLLKHYLSSYLSEKGKNLATKEDIAGITSEVESVKDQYAKGLEEFRSSNQLKLAAIEREKKIRRDVYLEATEAITRQHNIISGLSNLDTDYQVISSAISDNAGVIAKIQIVGSEETVRAVAKVMAAIGTSVAELTPERYVLTSRKNHIAMLEEFRLKHQKEIERYVELMKQLNLEGNSDARLWETINRNVEFETSQRDKKMEELDELRRVQNGEHILFLKKCTDRFFEISKFLPGAVLSARNDLGLPISKETYLEIFGEHMSEGQKVLNVFIAEISNGKQ